jgi:hypothetical protein
MKMKMKVKYFAKIKTLSIDEEIKPEIQVVEERQPGIDFVYSFYSSIDFAKSY